MKRLILFVHICFSSSRLLLAKLNFTSHGSTCKRNTHSRTVSDKWRKSDRCIIFIRRSIEHLRCKRRQRNKIFLMSEPLFYSIDFKSQEGTNVGDVCKLLSFVSKDFFNICIRQEYLLPKVMPVLLLFNNDCDQLNWELTSFIILHLGTRCYSRSHVLSMCFILLVFINLCHLVWLGLLYWTIIEPITFLLIEISSVSNNWHY